MQYRQAFAAMANGEVVSQYAVDSFIVTFCEYELADNNYDIIKKDAAHYYKRKSMFEDMPADLLLKHLTYIIWTDKITYPGFLKDRIGDGTIYRLLARLSAVMID